MTFAKRIKELRQEKGWSQEELGKLVGVSSRVIGYYESGERFPKAQETLVALAQTFGVSLDYLLDNPVRSESSCPSRFCYAKTMNAIDRAAVNQFIRFLRFKRDEEGAEVLENDDAMPVLDEHLQALVDQSAADEM